MVEVSLIGNVLQGDIENWLFFENADCCIEEELDCVFSADAWLFSRSRWFFSFRHK